MVRLNEVRDGELQIDLPTRTDAEVYFIGRIRTPWTDRLTCPRQGRADGPACRLSGIKVLAMKVDSIAEFERATTVLGALVGERQRAKNVVDSVRATLERVRSATASLPKTTVFYHTWEKPIITIGRESFMNDLVDIAGGRNIYGDMSSVAPVVTLEDVIARKPEVVLAGPGSDGRMYASSTWMTIPAVKNHRVLMYDTMVVGRPSVTLGMAAINWANLLHPGVVK